MEIHHVRFGCPWHMDSDSTFFPILRTTWTRELVVTTIWVDESLLHLVTHCFKAWFINEPNRVQEGPLQGFDEPTIETKDGEVAHPMDIDILDCAVEDPAPESKGFRV